MTGLTRRFLVMMMAIVLTLSLGAFAIPVVPVEAASPSVNVGFGTAHTLDIQGNSFTNGEVMGNTSWGSGFTNNATSNVAGVGLALDTALTFDGILPAPQTMGPPITWSFGDIVPGQHIDVGAGHPDKGVNVVVPGQSGLFTPGFDASRSVDNTIFTQTGTQTQTLTIKVTTHQTQPNQNYGVWFIVVGAWNTGNVISTITSPTTDYSNGISLDQNGQQLTIRIENPPPETTYTYQVSIQVTPLVPRVEFMPNVAVSWWETNVNSGTAPGVSSFSRTVPDLGTWTWSTVGNYDWQWGEDVGRSVSFNGYSNSPSANVQFSTNDNYSVSGDSFTNGPVTGNENWFSQLNVAGTDLHKVSLNLASSKSFDNFGGPTPPYITGSTGAYNYEWDFGTITTGGGVGANVGLNNSPVTFTPGFNASRSADKTTFSASGPQTLTVSVTPRQVFQGIGIGVNLPEDQYVNATIASVTALDGAPLDNYGISPEKSNMNININNPTIGKTYTYTITIHLTLINGVTQVDYIPNVNVNAGQSVAHGSVTGTSFSHDTAGAGTWTWSSDDSITWNWNEGLNQGVNFQGYSIQPNATVVFITDYAYGVSGNSFKNGAVTGNENWFSNITWTSASLNDVCLNLVSSTSFNNFEGPTPPNSISTTEPYDYQWDFGTVTTGNGVGGAVGLNNSPITFTPGFDASSIANQTTFTKSGTQTLTVSVTPREAINSFGISLNVFEDQYVNPTIESVTPAGGVPTNPGISNDGKNLFFPINNPTTGATYTYTITIQVNLQPGVTQVDYMPGVSIYAFQLGVTGGSSTGKSVSSPTTGAGTWTWSSDDSITWNWNEGLSKGVNFQGYSTGPLQTGNAITALNGNITIGNSTNVTSSPGLSTGGNLLANGNISLGNSIKINGNATASGSITKGISNVISGTVKPNAGVINFAVVNTSPYLAEVQLSKGGTVVPGASYANGGTINAKTLMQGNLSLNNSKTLTVNGDLYADSGSITIGSSSTLTINGNLYIANGSLIAGSSSKITVTGTVYMSGNLQAGTSATLSLGKVVWVGGGITLGNTSRMSGPQTIVSYSNIIFGNSNIIGNPQMQLIISTNGGISLGTSDQLSGYLYAPTAGASIGNSSNVTGSIIAKSVTIGSSCLITYGGN